MACRQGDLEAQKWILKKIPFHRLEENYSSAVVQLSEPALGFSEKDTKSYYTTLRLKPARSLLAPVTQEEQAQLHKDME